MSVGLRTHGKVVKLVRLLKPRGDKLRVIGALFAVWCVFDEHSEGGLLEGYSLDSMDDAIGWPGFSAAMSEIGWLIETEDGLEAPDYEEHNGPNAKRRATDNSRKGKTRSEQRSFPEMSGSDADTDPHDERTDVGEMSASDADNLRNRVRVDKRKKPHSPLRGGRFTEFWEAWPRSKRKGGKAVCEGLWDRGKLDSQADAILAHVLAMRGSADWLKQAGEFIPAPEVYLRGKRWDGADAGEPGTAGDIYGDGV